MQQPGRLLLAKWRWSFSEIRQSCNNSSCSPSDIFSSSASDSNLDENLGCPCPRPLHMWIKVRAVQCYPDRNTSDSVYSLHKSRDRNTNLPKKQTFTTSPPELTSEHLHGVIFPHRSEEMEHTQPALTNADSKHRYQIHRIPALGPWGGFMIKSVWRTRTRTNPQLLLAQTFWQAHARAHIGSFSPTTDVQTLIPVA